MKRRVNSWHNLTNTSDNLSEKLTRLEYSDKYQKYRLTSSFRLPKYGLDAVFI